MNISDSEESVFFHVYCSLQRCGLGVFVALLLGAVVVGCSAKTPPKAEVWVAQGEQRLEPNRPNIVLLLIDDMGVNDLGVAGNPAVRTPNLDALAARGVRFTRNYVDSTCTATRVGILTGMPPAALGFRPNQLGISPEVNTLPDLLRTGGYTTHHIGKWHLGAATRLAWPLQQGFDSFFGFLSQFLLRGPHTQGKWLYGPPTYLEPWLTANNEQPQQHQGHLSELMVSHVEQFLDAKRGEETPWFLNFWTYAPHDPIQPTAEFSQRYPSTPEGKYLAFIEQIDATVGRVIEGLERNGLTENTLLLVASDNGGTNKYVDNNAPFNGGKMTYLEGGVRTPLIIYWPNNFDGGEVFDGIVSNFDYLPTLLSAAGIETPAALTGRNLLQVQRKNSGLSEPLFWEMSNSDVHSWGALSADGQWRLSQFFAGEPVLHNLVENRAGDKDVLSVYPEKAADLLRQYQIWHRDQRRVRYEYDQLEANGRSRLTGQSLQRSPGYAGNTFVIGITPESNLELSPQGVVGDQMIAYQENQWQLQLRGSRLTLNINGIILRGSVPNGAQCSSVVVSSHFVHSHINPKRSRAMIELYVNGERVAQTLVPLPSLPPDSHLSPTYIGQDGVGERRFVGKLGRPLILNERLVSDENQSVYLGNGIQSLPDDICQA